MERRQRAVDASDHQVSDIGRYRLVAELARGGMGVVYLALVRGPGGFNKLFVIKELKAHLAEDPALVALFVEEARISAKLNHPNVVQTIEVGSDGRRHFIAMEFLEGQALNRVLSRTERNTLAFPPHFHLQIIADMLDGLHYTHELCDFDGRPLGLVHRDVSPHNLFVGYDGQVKVLDFGIAKALDSSHQTGTGVLKGKIAYMSPEQASGLVVDRRADIFAAGVMLWEAVVGERMWGPTPNDLQILRALTMGNLPRVRERRPDVDEALARIIDRATIPAIDARYPTAAAFQAELEAYVRSLPVPRFGGREMGKFVADLFADEREFIKKVVDDQLRLLRGVDSGQYASITLPRLSPHLGANGTPSATPALDGSGHSDSMQQAARANSASGVRGSIHLEPGPPPPWKRPALVVGAVALAIAASSAATIALHPSQRPAPAADPTNAATSSEAAAVPSQTPLAPIRAKVTVSPATATISVDDGPPQAGAYAGNFVRDGASHTVRIAAPDYEPKTLQFAADGDHTFDIGLEPHHETSPSRGKTRGHAATSVAAGPASAVATASAAPTTPPPAPTATDGKRLQIDTKDPYAQ